MPLKAFNADGTSRAFDIVRAIYYAVDHGARVINMSFSATMSSAEIARAINYATDRGVICVASAGNLGQEVVVYPGGFRNVLGVASTELGDPAGAQLVQQLRRCAREPGRARRSASSRPILAAAMRPRGARRSARHSSRAARRCWCRLTRR